MKELTEYNDDQQGVKELTKYNDSQQGVKELTKYPKQKMEAIKLKGKKYIPVNERLKFFRAQPEYKDWIIIEEIIKLDDEQGLFKVSIYSDSKDLVVDSTGKVISPPKASAHAHEYKDRGEKNLINHHSLVENGFTSALGRALGYLGIGIDTAIASYEEVNNAINFEKNFEKNFSEDNRKWLSESEFQATLNGTYDQAQLVLVKYKMKKIYREEIVNHFKPKKE